ncbi:MAG TPA: hypothetical protein VNW50_11225 [Streptosporangiaceae bacterium]|nr:hypothetical protein [Streptosporangiaceae bacterium]
MFTTAFDVFGASRALPRRSVFPVTDVPDSTAITVCGTTPVRSVGFASLEPGIAVETGGLAMVRAGLPEAAAGLACPAANAMAVMAVMAVTDAAASFFCRIHPVALIDFPFRRNFLLA